MPLLLLLLIAHSPPAVTILATGPQGSELARLPQTDALTGLVRLFNQATSTIDIAQMYMLYYPPESKGHAIYPLYDALIAAAQRGVQVRILLDSTTLEANRTPTYHRIRWTLAAVPGIAIRTCDLRPFSRYPGCLMHAKYAIIDGRTVVVGSHNWSFAGFCDNLELSLAIEDRRLARELGEIFESDWLGQPARQLTDSSNPDNEQPSLVITSPTQRQDTNRLSTRLALQQLFAKARTDLAIIINSITRRVDFGPDSSYDFIDSLLADANERQVRTRLLVDKWALERESTLLQRLGRLSNIEVRVCDISKLGPNPRTGSVHAKLVIADTSTVLLGSATFSQRQIEECRNIGIMLTDKAVAATLLNTFESLWYSVFSHRP